MAVPIIKTINSVTDLFQVIRDSGLMAIENSHLKIWFRGHSDSSWQLHPGVYRDNFQPDNNEDSRLRKEQHLNQDFRVFSAGMRTGNETDSQLYFLQQHYGMPTRLLDWSNNPMAALFFAVIANNDKDGRLFIMNTDEFGFDTGMGWQLSEFKGIATGTNYRFIDALKAITSWKPKEQFPNFIIPVRPDYIDKRMSLQKSCFTFHVPTIPTLKREHNKTLEEFHIPKDAKEEIRKELSMLGTDYFNIYGDLEGLAKTLKKNYRID